MLFKRKNKDIKNKSKNKIKSKEFRYNKARTGHPSYIVSVNGNKVTIIGITERDRTHKQNNIKLDENPAPNKKDQKAYIRPVTETITFTDKTFSKKLENWAFAESDKPKVKNVIEKSAKKRQSRSGKPHKR